MKRPSGTIESSPSHPCHGCSGTYSLAEDERQRPMLLHSLPYCEAFLAVETVEDAVRFSRKSRAVKGQTP